MAVLRLERIYDKPANTNGYRILVDHGWVRGLSQADAQLDLWAKYAAPSTELRKWFNHIPERFPEFVERYTHELTGGGEGVKGRQQADNLKPQKAKKPSQAEAYQELKRVTAEQLKAGNDVIVLYSARDREHNQAVVLFHLLERDLCVQGVVRQANLAQ
ncbi:DUF488 domain-containing protein [Aeriscardovia aeriphila]|uniref:Uroporphyrin-III C-methyltransferase n=1 Tax=Aeriscardovia aeriphila TaxID=218139 RepID=A0A261F9M3_9BIFI|nr:DUF488 family protein [Aeriscardovia aeriphila]NYI26002.1 uncharacterized protein YeaO (DUF488 family) [Aeriscardovia aeriphila]OZG55850.1 uroporphyrin-III C-methyltransferase [Aeriscardovia aeriphila]